MDKILYFTETDVKHFYISYFLSFSVWNQVASLILFSQMVKMESSIIYKVLAERDGHVN